MGEREQTARDMLASFESNHRALVTDGMVPVLPKPSILKMMLYYKFVKWEFDQMTGTHQLRNTDAGELAATLMYVLIYRMDEAFLSAAANQITSPFTSSDDHYETLKE